MTKYFSAKKTTSWTVTELGSDNDPIDFPDADSAWQHMYEEAGDDFIVGDGKFRTAEAFADFPLNKEKCSTEFGRTLAYLPSNYGVELRLAGRDKYGEPTFKLVISGVDNAGWTLDGYVIPRLASGNIHFTEKETN